jgi:transposase
LASRMTDHSVFSRARHERFRQSDALRRVFESVVAKSIAAGLVGGEGFSVDASLIKADVDKKKRKPGISQLFGRRLRKRPARSASI